MTSSDRAQGGVTAAVVIPARDEARRIAVALDALLPQMGPGHRIVIVANDCRDGTVAVAREAVRDRRLVILDCVLEPGQGVGFARRTGSLFAMAQWPGLEAILTTDADCIVAPDWIAANLAHLAQVDAVCGNVEPIPEETAILAGMPSVEGWNEAVYADLVRRFYDRHAPEPANPYPHHGQAAGASLAVRTGPFCLAGGFADLRSGEDRALVRALRAQGATVRHAGDVTVAASCRLTGRAPSGMAAALRERLAGTDYRVDQCLPPVAQLSAMLARGRLDPWPPEMPDALRLRPADLPGEIEALRRLLGEGDAAAPGTPAQGAVARTG